MLFIIAYFIQKKEKVFSPSTAVCAQSIGEAEFIFIIIIGRKILLSFNACMPHPVINNTSMTFSLLRASTHVCCRNIAEKNVVREK
jgi:hypothetical protein